MVSYGSKDRATERAYKEDCWWETCSSWCPFSGLCFFFFSSRRRHTRYIGDWSSDCALPISPVRAGGRPDAPSEKGHSGPFGHGKGKPQVHLPFSCGESSGRESRGAEEDGAEDHDPGDQDRKSVV